MLAAIGCPAWLLRALPGPHWNVLDGIEDGIPEESVLEFPGAAIFQWKCRLIVRYSLLRVDNCRMEFPVSLTVSTLHDQAKTPSPQGSSQPIDNRVGMLSRHEEFRPS